MTRGGRSAILDPTGCVLVSMGMAAFEVTSGVGQRAWNSALTERTGDFLGSDWQ